jgi:hypothetical protein
MRAVHLQLIALLAAVAVLFSSGASARTQYLCRVTGVVLADCCCAVAGPARAAHRVQQARPADCCDRIVTAARSGATGTRDASRSIAGAALAAVLPPHVYAPPTAELIALAVRSTRAPPAVGPPLFVAHCALLI